MLIIYEKREKVIRYFDDLEAREELGQNESKPEGLYWEKGEGWIDNGPSGNDGREKGH